MFFLVISQLNMKVKKALSDDFQPLLSQFIPQVQNPAFVVKVHAIDDTQE